MPVGKAYFGFTDEELKQLDNWVRNNTVERFGPVREVAQTAKGPGVRGRLRRRCSARPGTSPAWRCAFPRINRIRWDKPAAEADRLETLSAMIGGE